MDLSDGLADAVRQVACAGATGARLDAAALPLHPAASGWFSAARTRSCGRRVGRWRRLRASFAVPPGAPAAASAPSSAKLAASAYLHRGIDGRPGGRHRQGGRRASRSPAGSHTSSGHARSTRFRTWLNQLLHTHDTPQRTAIAYAIGVFFGFSPFLGLHTVLGLVVAFAFSLNRVAVSSASTRICPGSCRPTTRWQRCSGRTSCAATCLPGCSRISAIR